MKCILLSVKKVWIFYVYAPKTEEILAVTMGKGLPTYIPYNSFLFEVLNIKFFYFLHKKTVFKVKLTFIANFLLNTVYFTVF